MLYENLESYLEAYADNPNLAFVPVSLVAEHLNVSPQAVVAMLRTNRLNEVRVGRGRYVLLESLIKRKEDFDNSVVVVERYLAKIASKGIRAVTYEPVMKQLGLSPTIPADRTRIGKVLGEVSLQSYSTKRCLLSVLVHRKSAGVTRPGPGFFNLARSMQLDCENEDEFVKRQTDRVLRAYAN